VAGGEWVRELMGGRRMGEEEVARTMGDIDCPPNCSTCGICALFCKEESSRGQEEEKEKEDREEDGKEEEEGKEGEVAEQVERRGEVFG